MNRQSPLHIKEAAYEKQNRKMRLEQALEEFHLHVDLLVWPEQ